MRVDVGASREIEIPSMNLIRSDEMDHKVPNVLTRSVLGAV